MSSNGEYESNSQIGLMHDTLKSPANDALVVNSFLVQTHRDTIIENQDGVIIYIPEHAFDTEADQVELKVQSAIDGADIMLAGLSTMSDSNQLETGGMVFIDAIAEGNRVSLIKDLEIKVPTEQRISGMMHYQGETLPNGDINWVNPKPLTKDLTPVDILSLDFYPPNYEDTLKQWGYTSKRFTDSLYYAFGFGNEEINGNQAGEQLFRAKCASCHQIDTELTAPPLRGAMANWEENSSLDNMIAFTINSQAYIRRTGDPYARQLLDDYNGSIMPAQPITENEVELIFEYVEGFKLPSRRLTREEADFIYGSRSNMALDNNITFTEAKILFDAGRLYEYQTNLDLDLGP